MKYNLKNRSNKHILSRDDIIELYWDTEEWFEGFQKELEQHYRTWSPQLPGEELVNMLIKEILGE